jgi:hypothetical protein
LGLREEEPSFLIESNKSTVLGLGDSFTEGAGAPKDSTWLASLQRFGKQHQLKAINGGSISSDILFEYYKLDTKLYDLYQPKQVILSINKTDISDFNENGGLNRYQNPDRFVELDSPWWSFFYTFSPGSRYFFHEALNWDNFGSPENSIKKEQKSILAINQTLLKFQKHATKNNYDFYLIIIPLIEEFENETLELKHLDQFCKKHKINSFNLYNYMIENRIDYHEYYWMKDGHLNPAGYELLGELVYQQFIESDSF